MLLELNQSPLGQSLERLSAKVVAIFELLAGAADGAKFAELRGSMPAPAPSEAAVERILGLPRAQRRALLEAARSDLRFPENLDNEGFRFAFRELAPDTRDAGKRLMGELYEKFVRPGIDTGEGGSVGRAAWEASFRDANPDVKVCPACLMCQLEEPIKGRSAVDADHYLPKSIYPPLALHGLNLVPICRPCNTAAKGTLDPLKPRETLHGLPSVWFPYHRPGILELQLGFRPGERQEASVAFEGEPGAERRAELFDELFDLSSRWGRSLRGVHEAVVELLRFADVPAEEAAVKDRLLKLSRSQRKAAASSPKALLTSAYCAWLAGDAVMLPKVVGELA